MKLSFEPYGRVVPVGMIIAVLLSALACGGGSGAPGTPGGGDPIPLLPGGGDSTPERERRKRLSSVESWGYVLDFSAGVGLSDLQAADYDLFVIDYSLTGAGEGEFTGDDIGLLREGTPERIVLAYLSIGEAEDYRFYWDESWVNESGDILPWAPSWLGPANPNWSGNYKVRYWYQEWQDIILGAEDGDSPGYIERIISAGFDGVYLDMVDAYEFWGPDGEAYERDDAARLMAVFVVRIAARARAVSGDSFLVFPQNAPHLFSELSDTDRKELLASIDGIGAEDVFYFGGLDEDNPLSVEGGALYDLRSLQEEGKLVLSVEYLTRPELISAYYPLARAEGFIPLATVRGLDSIPPPFE